MTRIAVGGFQHETNTFAPTKATYDAFVHGGGFPHMAIGGDVLKNVRRINVPLAGFIESAEAEGSARGAAVVALERLGATVPPAPIARVIEPRPERFEIHSAAREVQRRLMRSQEAT